MAKMKTTQVKRWCAPPEKDDERINRLKTPQDCEIFERNVTERGFPELAARARRRAVELRVAEHNVQNDIEKETLAALYAHEKILMSVNGKKTKASGSWLILKRRGTVAAIKSMTASEKSEMYFSKLKEHGLEDFSFEAIVVKHTTMFEPDMVDRCAARLKSLQSN